MPRPLPRPFLSLLLTTVAMACSAQAIVADHHAADDFDLIPAAIFDQVREEIHLFYGHTSHGSQVSTGMQMLEDEDPVRYADISSYEPSDDLGQAGDLSWVQPTRDYLDAHPECSLAMWSWCGGVSGNTPAGIAIYLEAMNQLELDYPQVRFVYMTGHLDGTGPDGNLYLRNQQIRDYCLANDKTLYDFADIESYDPEGVWYPDDDDSCGWCTDWCAAHPCPDCGYCAHTHCFNCYRKGRASWWLLARVVGWSGGAVPAPDRPAGAVALAAAWPNPFNPQTTLAFSLPRPMPARLVILDGRGRLVAELADGPQEAGRHERRWDGCDRHGRAVPSGSYFSCLITPEGRRTGKLTLLK